MSGRWWHTAWWHAEFTLPRWADGAGAVRHTHVGTCTTRGGAALTQHVRHLTGADALRTCADGYDALAGQTGAPVTARHTWLQTWADCFPHWTVWIPVVEDDGALVAAAPLARRRQGGVLVVRGIGFGRTDDVRLPVRDDDAARRLADAVHDGLAGRGPWVLEVEQLPEHEAGVRALAGRLPHARIRPGDGMPTVRVTERDLNRYLSKNTRKALAKIENRLAAAGLVPEQRWISDPGEIVAVLPELARVHRLRDEAMGRRTDHSDPCAARFYQQVVRRHAARGEVQVLTIRLGGQLAAYVLGFVDGTALRSWDNRLAPDFAPYSAGRLANTEALRHVVMSPELDELDWMRGEEPYKLQSATEVVPRVTLTAASSMPVAVGRATVETAREAKRGSATLTRLWRILHQPRFRSGPEVTTQCQ